MISFSTVNPGSAIKMFSDSLAGSLMATGNQLQGHTYLSTYRGINFDPYKGSGK